MLSIDGIDIGAQRISNLRMSGCFYFLFLFSLPFLGKRATLRVRPLSFLYWQSETAFRKHSGCRTLGLKRGTRKPSIQIQCPEERCFAFIPSGINAWASCCNSTNRIFITALIFTPASRHGMPCRTKIQRMKLNFACCWFSTMQSTKGLFPQT